MQLKQSLKKAKPRDSVLLPLLKSTYGERRMFVLNEAVSVDDILSKHPVLSHPLAVSNAICVYVVNVYH